MSIGNGKKETLVEEGTEFQGTMRSACPVIVNGSMDGTIEAPSLTVSPMGKVLGTVRVTELKSDGTLAGNIDADKVSLSGNVHSDTVIRAKSLEVKLSAQNGKLEVTFGECNLEVGDEPSANDAASDETKEAKSMPAVADVAAADGEAPESEKQENGSANGNAFESSWSQPPPPN